MRVFVLAYTALECTHTYTPYALTHTYSHAGESATVYREAGVSKQAGKGRARRRPSAPGKAA